ncbi:hypothetical protein [Sphingomonas beigongshangi]|uniref:hypothetical protein n=1 Tax=Sphingomonas beigongshangi TaxID=2782540 RepID=UPI00193B6500|nr:hypothetical protein [Sphingomonas beigongshangi]
MQDDSSYFYDRAETELELAQRAVHPMAVRAHYIIANHYLDRCYGSGDAVTDTPDEDAVAA